VDPLHSTGIAHALSGVVRIAEYLTDNSTVDSSSSRRWTEYDRQLRQEVEWLDLLVGGCYQALPSFDKFCAFAAWYFVAAIEFERVMARDPREWTNGYMTSGENTMRAAAEESFRGLSSQGEYEFLEKLRRAISPWNDVGLLEPATGRRIRHTAPPKFASRLHS
jgi:FADH2 O2-dependent halogenase